MSDYVPSNEWMVVDSPAVKNIKYYPCCEEPYPDLTFTVKLKRSVVIAAIWSRVRRTIRNKAHRAASVFDALPESTER